ncbi:MAG: helix-turn-helix domain-containing protein, partial [Dehalococcoidia bacterium]
MPATARWPDLGAFLHEARHRTALTQYHVAQQIGITQAAYSQIERGLIRPRPALLLPLAVLFGIGLGQLT